MFYRVTKPTQLAPNWLGKKIKQEKKRKAKVIAEFDETTFILSDNDDAASELRDEDNYQFLLEGAYDSDGQPFSCTNSGAKGKSLVQMACERSTAVRKAMEAVSASSDMFTSNAPPRRQVYDGTMNLEELHQETLLEDLDKIVLANKESGNRILHRHKQADANIDYTVLRDSGILSTNQYAENYKRMSESGISLLQKSVTFCFDCGHALIVSSKDSHISNAVIVYCSNNECRDDKKRN